MTAPNERFRLSRYIDGEGSPSEQEETRRRLGEEPKLRSQLDELQADRRRIKLGLLRTAPPVDLADRVLARLDRGGSSSAGETRILPMVQRLAMAAAILFVLLCLGLYWLKDHRGIGLEVEAGPPVFEFVPPDDYTSELDASPVSPLGIRSEVNEEVESDVEGDEGR